MKVGEQVISTKVRPGEPATITHADMVAKWRDNNGVKKKEIRTTYRAKYPDGSELTFYGFNIGKSIFKFEKSDGQMDLSEFMNLPVT